MFVGCGCHCKEPGSSESIPSGSALQPPQSLSFSINSFGSSIADPPGTYPTRGCTYCLDSVGPAIYEMEWDYQGALSNDPLDPRPCCAIYRNQKKYSLIRSEPAPGSGACLWRSREPAMFHRLLANGTNECLPMDGTVNDLWPLNFEPRVTFTLMPILPDFLYQPWHVVVYFYTNQQPIDPNNTFTYNYSLGLVWYRLLNPDGSYYTHFQGNPVTCLRQLVFERVDGNPGLPDEESGPVWSPTYLRGNGYYGGAPCRQVLFSGFDMGLPKTLTLTPVPA